MGSGGLLHAFLTSALNVGEWSPSAPLCMSLYYPLDKRLVRLENRSGRCGDKSLALSGIEPRFLGHPAEGLVTIPIAVEQ
jgi:hypothetical protein